jgi:hypothetical protein
MVNIKLQHCWHYYYYNNIDDPSHNPIVVYIMCSACLQMELLLSDSRGSRPSGACQCSWCRGVLHTEQYSNLILRKLYVLFLCFKYLSTWRCTSQIDVLALVPVCIRDSLRMAPRCRKCSS